MSIRIRLVLIVLLPVIVIWASVFYAAESSRKSLQTSIERYSANSAAALMDAIERFIGFSIGEWEVYTNSQDIRDFLRASNLEYADLENREEYIDQIDAQWLESTTDMAILKDLLHGPLAVDLTNKINAHSNTLGTPSYGEVFITNRYGTNIAQTNITTDFRQNDEEWWNVAMRERVFVSDVGYDESAQIYSFDVCIRIDDLDGEAMGVLKAVLNIDEIITLMNHRRNQLNETVESNLILLTGDGRTIYDCNRPEAAILDLQFQSDISAFSTDHLSVLNLSEPEGEERIGVLVRSEELDIFGGNGLMLLLTQDAHSLLKPARTLRSRNLVLAATVTPLIVLIAGSVVISLSRRIHRLSDAAVAFGNGESEFDLEDNGRDEISKLARSFQTMASSLKRAASTREKQAGMLHDQNTALRDEIMRRTSAEESLGEILDTLQIREKAINAAAILAITDRDGTITHANDMFCRVSGYSYEELVGQNHRIVNSGHHPKSFFVEMYKVIGSGQVWRGEICNRAKDGSEYWVDSTIVPVNNDAGEPEQYVVLRIDITRRKQLQTQLLHVQKLESIGQLAAGIAYEINTPIQYVGDNTRFVRDSIKGLLLLVDQYAAQLDPEAQATSWEERLALIKQTIEDLDLEFLKDEIPKAIEQTLDGVDRVTEIVRAMKDFSHPGSEEKKPTDLNKAIQSTITVCRNRWKYVSDLETDFQDNLPMVPCLVGEFNQVILNIVVNAADAIGSIVGDGGQSKGRIIVSTQQIGEFVEIRVSDTGGGIPKEIRQKIFDPFFTTKKVGKGTGQGLAISHDVVVNKHGGTIDLEVEPGVGTTFIIRMPIAAEPAIVLEEAA